MTSRIGASAFSAKLVPQSGGIPQQLKHNGRAAHIAGSLRDHRGDGAAGGISGDGDAAEVSTDLAAMLGDPPRCGPSIFDGSGVGVLRRQPVVDGHDNRVSADGVLAAGAIVRVEVAHDESAAMEIQHNGRLGLIGTRWRPIDPGPDRPRRSIDRKVNDPQLGVHRLAR